MPIVQKKPTAPADFTPIVPKIEAPKTKSVVIDTKYTPRMSLLKYVEGAPWTVNYYSQIHDKDNATYSQDPSQTALYQQYRKIEHLQLRVDTALSTQQDQETKDFAVKGSALLPLSVIPNEGDMFAADVGDGREGIFQIDNSEKRSIFKESVYFIEYTMLYFSDKEPVRRKDLENKVVQKLHYIKELAQYGQNPLITTDRYKTLLDISDAYQRLKSQYFQWFFSKEFSTIILPGQTAPTYDSYVVRVIRALYLTNDVYEYKMMRSLNIEDDAYLKRPTVWDALLQKSIHILDTCESQVGIIGTTGFNNDPMTESIYHSGISSIIYPKIRNEAMDEPWNHLEKPPAEDKLVSMASRYGNILPLLEDNTVLYLDQQMTLIHPILTDDYYVFTKAFYESVGEPSLIEVLAKNYLQNEANNPELVLKLMNNSWKWGGLERFYYVPVLLILAIDIIKDL